MKLVFCILIFSMISKNIFAASEDYQGMSFLDQNLRVGFSISYSKLEANSDVGNFYLLSSANPRIDFSYDSGVNDYFRQRLSIYVLRELFRPENDSLRVKSKLEQNNYGIGWQPMWVTEGRGFSYGLKFGAKSGTIISEIPTIYTVNGDIATRYSAEAGLCFNWFGQTVSKFPISLGLETVYSYTAKDNSVLKYNDGYVYRFTIEFDFKKKSLFSGWNLKGYYSYEDIKNDYSHFVDKELGGTLNKVITF